MKPLLLAMLTAGALLSSTAAYANADDAKWIAQCVTDNKDEGVSAEIIAKYCTCMDNKMPDSETRSITQWEKTHVHERKACDKESGWK
jgi:hypothetical protein